MRRKILVVLFWSVIAEAFIGPGTLVTASTAGANYGLGLVWTLVFATLACIIFQEMAARLTIVTQKDLASTLRQFKPFWLISLIPFGVVLGCIAYEAGNLLGAAIGLNSLFGISMEIGLLVSGGIAIALITFTSVNVLVRILGGLVALMGLMFFYLAFQAEWSFGELVSSAFVPEIPAGATWVVLALIGTTVVPYNFFLGSGLSSSSSLKDMRFGILISVLLGGLVSLAVLLTGTLLEEGATLNKLIEVVGEELGPTSQFFMASGIFAAGLTSAITAPLAAGFIANNYFSAGDTDITKFTAMTVVLVGTIMGFLDVRPEALILAAQAANGFALPIIAAFLWYITNHAQYMGNQVSSILMNLAAFLLMNVLIILGSRSLIQVFGNISGQELDVEALQLLWISLPITGLLVWVSRKARLA